MGNKNKLSDYLLNPCLCGNNTVSICLHECYLELDSIKTKDYLILGSLMFLIVGIEKQNFNIVGNILDYTPNYSNQFEDCIVLPDGKWRIWGNQNFHKYDKFDLPEYNKATHKILILEKYDK
jgi:hypothetical protein